MRKPLAKPPINENVPGLMPVELDGIVLHHFFNNFCASISVISLPSSVIRVMKSLHLWQLKLMTISVRGCRVRYALQEGQ
jgi:hypothetical protein